MSVFACLCCFTKHFLLRSSTEFGSHCWRLQSCHTHWVLVTVSRMWDFWRESDWPSLVVLHWANTKSYVFLQPQLACRRDLSDRPRLASKYAQTRHATLWTASFTRQFSIISFRWTRSPKGLSIGRTWLRKENSPNSGSPLQFCQTERQRTQHSFSSRHANGFQSSRFSPTFPTVATHHVPLW